jgi:hypothetical protein
VQQVPIGTAQGWHNPVLLRGAQAPREAWAGALASVPPDLPLPQGCIAQAGAGGCHKLLACRNDVWQHRCLATIQALVQGLQLSPSSLCLLREQAGGPLQLTTLGSQGALEVGPPDEHAVVVFDSWRSLQLLAQPDLQLVHEGRGGKEAGAHPAQARPKSRGLEADKG